MGYKKDDPCLKKAFEDERLFVLMTRDGFAPHAVIEWIKWSISTQPPEKLHEALDCAIEMSKRSGEFNGESRKRKEKIKQLKEKIHKS